MCDCERGGEKQGYGGYYGEGWPGGHQRHEQHHCCCGCQCGCGGGHYFGGMPGPLMSRKKKLEMLQEMKEGLEEKLEAINERIEELKKKGK